MSIFPGVEVVKPKALVLIALSLFVYSGLRGETAPSFEGIVSATLSRAGTQPSHFEFTRKGNLVRIENTTNKLEPINIVDLAANKLTIIYPHNTTFVRVDLAKKPAVAGIGDPGAAINDRGYNKSPQNPVAGAPTGAGGAPALPNPMMIPPMPNPATAGPMMPPMPPMPSMFGATELKKTEKTKKIQGFDCTLYTISDRGENFEIWATNDSALFPFRLIERDFIGHRFGPQMIEETWPELLRNKSLFPLEAILKMEPGGQERLSFKVDRIESPTRTGKKIDNAEELFSPPKNYVEMPAP
jgi:hypothetical protein